MESTSDMVIPEASEDSVDIYDGLDMCGSNSAESPRTGSRLKESMDLYEELVTEEEQNKEASYSELKSRFQAAQNQIQELRCRLEQMETKNSGLTSENFRLKKNLSALLQTARQEVKRKDAEILRLSQRSGKFHYHPQPPISLQNPNQSKHASTITSSSKPPPPPRPLPPPPPPPPPPSLPSGPVPPTPPPPPCPPRGPAQTCRRESIEMTRAAKTSSHGYSRRDGETPDKHKSKCREEKRQREKLPETTDRRHGSATVKQLLASEQNRSHRADGRRHEPKLCKSKVSNVENHCRSDGAKSSSPDVSHRSHSDKKGSSQERKSDKTKTAMSDSDRSAPSSSKKVHSREREERKNRRGLDSKEPRKASHSAERYRDSSKERRESREKGHQRKEDRRREDNSDQKQKSDSQSGLGRDREKTRSTEEKQKTMEVFPEQSAQGKKNSVEENSPNRKLCFMETLNLTLSPIKKPGSSNSACQEKLVPAEVQKTSDGDDSLPALEDMCVIDEIDASEPDAGFNEVSDSSLNAPNVENSEKTKSWNCVKAVEEKEKTSHRQSEDAAKSEIAVFLELKSPESRLCHIVEDLQNHQDEVKMDSKTKADDRESAEATEGTKPNEKPEGISEQQTNRDSENSTDSSAAEKEHVMVDSRAVPQIFSQDSPIHPIGLSPPAEMSVIEEITVRTSPKSQGNNLLPPQDSSEKLCPPTVSPQDSPEEPRLPAVPPQDSSEEPHPPAVPPQDSPEEPSPPAVPPQDSPEEPHPPAVPPQDSPEEPHPPAFPPQDSPEEPHPPAVPLPDNLEKPCSSSVPLQNSPQKPHPPAVPPQDSPEEHCPCSCPPQGSPQKPCPAVPHQDSLQEPRPLAVPLQKSPEEPRPPAAPHQDSPEECHPLAVPPQDSPQKLCPPAVPPQDSPEEPSPPAVPPKDSPQKPCPPVVLPQDSPEEPPPPAVPPKDSPQKSQPPTVLPQDSPEEPHPPAVPPPDSPQEPCSSVVPPQDSPQEPHPAPQNQSSRRRDSSKDPAAVLNTMSLESLPQEGLSLNEAILVLAQEDSTDPTGESSSSTGCIRVSKGGDAKEKVPERFCILPVTPKKKLKASSSMPSIHDEDSMMRTLSSLKRIPDAISPLRSPAQPAPRSLSHPHGRPGHVKSLQKEFSSAPVDASSKKLDVNKENKFPGSPANRDAPSIAEKASDLPSSVSDSDLEEGEIVSETDEAAAGSPAPAARRAKLAAPAKNKSSPKTVLKRKHEESCGTSKKTHETAAAASQSPKSRFKTVCPAATKASFSTVDDIMETFKLVRTEIRKKYMKLHKTFPKKSFYGVMDNFQESFLEFVDGAQFGTICSHSADLKSKLKKLITSVFSKVSNNGIVKRIFEQQAVDMKQKLWDFVDAQVSYLFREIDTTLQGLCKQSQSKCKASSRKDKSSGQSPTRKSHCLQTEAQSPPIELNPSRPCTYKKGLGSRGKDIRLTLAEREGKVDFNLPNGPNSKDVVEFLPPRNFSTPEKNRCSLAVAQNGSLADKTDFQLLTEQQASSLTFNLVRDSQMGEIFKCLLQGSDLLESNGDNGTWALASPRKDGERFISVTTPTKFDSPSKLFSPAKLDTPTKLVAAWASISPRRLSSQHLKDPVHLNPALFDESCMLEVPSETAVQSQKSFSILAEDLAVSLTIPSPLKSDSHLSFLQPFNSGVHLMSTPDSVISAHISEDALMDGEDATEQDIHLALDTDNSSCDPSSSSGASSPLATPFVFKPDMPMQALVMEKSNDHFIVKIRQASASITLTDEDSLDRTITGDEPDKEQDVAPQQSQSNTGFSESEEYRFSSSTVPSEPNLSSLPEHSAITQTSGNSDSSLTHTERRKDINKTKEASSPSSSVNCSPNESRTKLPEAVSDHVLDTSCQTSDDTIIAEESQAGLGKEDTPSEVLSHKPQKTISPCNRADAGSQQHLERSDKDQRSPTVAPHVSDSKRDEMDVSETERCFTITEDTSGSPPTDHSKSRKRKRHQKKSKAKRSKEEEPRKTSSATKDEESQSSLASLSPNSLSAKNVVRKKGEVVIAWTRDEDRAILIALKTEGASRDTFSALAEKLNKPSEQVAHRFHQLMKLFRKMDT